MSHTPNRAEISERLAALEHKVHFIMHTMKLTETRKSPLGDIQTSYSLFDLYAKSLKMATKADRGRGTPNGDPPPDPGVQEAKRSAPDPSDPATEEAARAYLADFRDQIRAGRV